MTEIQITEHPEQATATVRGQVPMAELADFFSHAFSDIMAALQIQGVQPVGPPFGKYYGQPGPLIDVEAGFPVPGIIDPAGHVVPGHLQLKPSEVMWEKYLADPETEQSSENARTQICWLVD